MTNISVTPDTFTFVDFSADEISEIAGELCDRLDLTSIDELRIEVDEASPLARASITSMDPVTLSVEGGAFEDTRKPRQLSKDRTVDTIGRYLLKATDRLNGAFGDAPSDEELSLAQASAWDVYAVGRLARQGHNGQRKRRLYQFRNRHGFSDAADVCFEKLWSTPDLNWADVDRISSEARIVP